MADSPQVTPPLRVNTPRKTPGASPAPPPRVDPQGDILFQPGRAPRRSTKCAPHIFHHDTESIPPKAQQKATETPKVPQVHKYITRSRHLKVQDLMTNHVTTINTPTSTPINPATLIISSIKDWAVIDQAAGNPTLQPVKANTVICFEMVKYQEYLHLIKIPDKLK